MNIAIALEEGNDRSFLLFLSASRRVVFSLNWEFRGRAAYRNNGFCEARKMDAVGENKPEIIETVEPIGRRVVLHKDEDKKQTKGGIQLPDNIEIPTITGRIVAVSAEIENDPDVPLRQYDKVLFNPKGAIPVDFEGSNRLFVVEVENIVAVFRKG